MDDDAVLLSRFVRENADAALSQLVQRHVGLVYHAALRRAGGNATLAEEIAQAVFTDLVRKARTLLDRPSLAGWLFVSTRYATNQAMRAEQRRSKREHEAAADMNAAMEARDDPGLEWERLQPLIDDALDTLPTRDREAVLLRYFQGCSFADVGARLAVSEDAARVRVARAIEKLRRVLARRGICSTAAAVAAGLAQQAGAAVPLGLAASVTDVSLAAAGAGSGASAVLLTMSKLTTSLFSGLVAAGIAVVSMSWIGRFHDDDVAALRRDNARLRAEMFAREAADARVAPAIPAPLGDPAAALVGKVQERSARSIRAVAGNPVAAQAISGYRNAGQATPQDALESFAWATDVADVRALSHLIWFDGNGHAMAEAVLARMPESVRQQYGTPEELYAFFTIADALVAPPPPPEVLRQIDLIRVHPDRAVSLSSILHPGRNEYQLTDEGWKRTYPERAVEDLARQVLATNILPPAP